MELSHVLLLKYILSWNITFWLQFCDQEVLQVGIHSNGQWSWETDDGIPQGRHLKFKCHSVIFSSKFFLNKKKLLFIIFSDTAWGNHTSFMFSYGYLLAHTLLSTIFNIERTIVYWIKSFRRMFSLSNNVYCAENSSRKLHLYLAL